MQISTQTEKLKVQKNVATKKSKLFKKMGLQGFIQAPTDLRLPEVKTQLNLNWLLKLSPLNQRIRK